MLASDLLKLATAAKDGTLSAGEFSRLLAASGYLGSTYASPEIDLVTGADVVLVPAKPGFYFLYSVSRVILRTAAGLYTTTATVKAGNNATFDNVLASTVNSPSAADFTAALAFVPIRGSQATAPTAPQLIDLTTPITLKITQAAAGVGLVLKTKIAFTGAAFVPVADLV